jgi:hypothetical protein
MSRRIRGARRASQAPAKGGSMGAERHENPEAMRARTTPAGESSAPSVDSERRDGPLDAEVASRAYAIWLGRGRPEGTDREDWFEAERQLREERGGGPP